MSNMDVSQVLTQMRTMKAAVASGQALSSGASAEVGKASKAEFSQTMKQAVEQVNAVQAKSSTLQTAYVSGSEQVDLPEVMMAVQEASISFQAISQVRNRLLSAYQDVMNMPL